jgi:putative oxidoreductase
MQHRTDMSRIDLGLAILRVVVGVIFVAHGAQKLFDYGLGNVAANFGKMGIPAASVTGPLVALVEFFGGLGLIGGLLTRLSGLGLAIDMLGAIVFVHLSKGLIGPVGFEFPLALLAASAMFTITGAGRYSLDHVIAARRHGASGSVAHDRRSGERRRSPQAA